MAKYRVASYYFPNYHLDKRNEARLGAGWTEWELVKAAKPRYFGHDQPKVPQWGYTDEADPLQMAQKIDAAVDHGVNTFIFDWYFYNDGPFLERGVEEGFMKAANADRMEFALMWANHDWVDIFPAKPLAESALIYPGGVTAETFDRMTDVLIENYFFHPSYWRIDGCPYFSLYELHTLIQGFGGVEQTAAVFKRFREKAVAAGLPGVHLNAVAWGVQILPNEKVIKEPEQLIEAIGFDSVSSYVWVHDIHLTRFPQTPYTEVLEKMLPVWERNSTRFGVPYFPNVTMGWDASPRCHGEEPYIHRGYPYMPSLSGNTPAMFQKALEEVRAFLDSHPQCQNSFSINCWNEWTEGSYLEPDVNNGMAYLEAVKNVFGS